MHVVRGPPRCDRESVCVHMHVVFLCMHGCGWFPVFVLASACILTSLCALCTGRCVCVFVLGMQCRYACVYRYTSPEHFSRPFKFQPLSFFCFLFYFLKLLSWPDCVNKCRQIFCLAKIFLKPPPPQINESSRNINVSSRTNSDYSCISELRHCT